MTCPECKSSNVVGPTFDKATRRYIARCKTCRHRFSATSYQQVELNFTPPPPPEPPEPPE